MLFDMYIYLLLKEKEITPLCFFSTSQIFKGLKDFRECRLEIKTPQEQTACLAHINTWLIIIATESILKKNGMKTISFQYNLRELQDFFFLRNVILEEFSHC